MAHQLPSCPVKGGGRKRGEGGGILPPFFLSDVQCSEVNSAEQNVLAMARYPSRFG